MGLGARNGDMIDPSVFKSFVPVGALNPADRAELAKTARVLRYERGQAPFRRGTSTSSAVFLLKGEVELEGDKGHRVIVAGTDGARYALSNASVFPDTATCTQQSEILFVDRAVLDRLLTWSQAGVVEVRDIDEDESGDWMAAMLHSPVMQQIPPSNIVRVIAAVERVEFAAQECVIREGAAGDYYYLVVEGECVVRRCPAPGAEPVEVDRVRPGQGFGEEALVSGAPRNATVETVVPSVLVRLARSDFERFLKEPMVQSLELAELNPDMQIIDVRMPEEFAGGHLPGAINIPLRTIRERCSELDAARPVAAYCDGGGRSASATFLLNERGFRARWLRGGVASTALTAREEH